MVIDESTLNTILVDLMVTKAKVRGLELTLSTYCKLINDTIDQNQSIIDTNKLVLDKLEEYLNEKIHE